MRNVILLTIAAGCLTGCNMFLDPYELGPDGTGADAGNDDVGVADMGGPADTGGPIDMGSTSDMGEATDMSEQDVGDEEDMATAENKLVVFDEAYAPGVTFSSFGGAVNDVGPVDGAGVNGSVALRVRVTEAGYTGGALNPASPVDVSAYDALRFSVRSTKRATLNVSGYGDSGFNTTYRAERSRLDLTTEWNTFVIPLPDPSRLTSLTALFHFAEGADEGRYDIFFDNIEYVELPGGALTGATAQVADFSPFLVEGTAIDAPDTTYNVQYAGDPISLALRGGHVDWNSDNTMIASVDDNGAVTAQSEGTVTITGFIGALRAGEYVATVVSGPSQPAPDPTKPAADVVAALFTDTYQTVPVDTFNKPNSNSTQAVIDLQGNSALLYTALDFAIIEMLGINSLDVTAATSLSIDIWTVNGVEFWVKLVDFGSDNMFLGGDDSETELRFVLAAEPGFQTGQWYTLEIPMSQFLAGPLRVVTNLSQIVIVGRSLNPSGDPVPGQSTFFVDNIFFHK